jgi:hypothetical protein
VLQLRRQGKPTEKLLKIDKSVKIKLARFRVVRLKRHNDRVKVYHHVKDKKTRDGHGENPNQKRALCDPAAPFKFFEFFFYRKHFVSFFVDRL